MAHWDIVRNRGQGHINRIKLILNKWKKSRLELQTSTAMEPGSRNNLFLSPRALTGTFSKDRCTFVCGSSVHSHAFSSVRLPNPHQNTSPFVCSTIWFHLFRFLHLPLSTANFTSFDQDLILVIMSHCNRNIILKCKRYLGVSDFQVFPIHFRITYFAIHICP